MWRRTARVLKYATIAVVLMLFGNVLWIFCTRPDFSGFGEDERHESAAIPKVLHIGWVVQSHSDCRYASLQVKSLLMHRHNPLHLHLLTNKRLAMILRTLIDTWHIPDLRVSFYMTDEIPDFTATDDLKFWLPVLVPESIHKLVIFDSSVIVGSDITALWQEFGMMRKEGKPLGVISATYNGELDTRLMLVNVMAIRNGRLFKGFASIMKEVAVYRIPSVWNLDSHCWMHTGPSWCAQFLSQHVSSTTLEQFMAYNSYQLQSLDQTESNKNESGSNFSEFCSEVQRPLTYRVHPYFINYSYQFRDSADITIVTQLSFDRMHVLMRLLELWEGPVSAAIHLEELQLIQLMEFIHNMPVFQRTNVGLHVVYKKGELLYPYNFLRNIAWNYSTTPYVILIDVDQMPSLGLYIRLKDAVRSTFSVNSVYVVPAFETFIKDLPLPSRKQSLQRYVSNKQVSPFKWHGFFVSHQPTNYSKWFLATEPYEVQWKKWYEPYIVVHRNATRYDERFAGYGGNKASHILELHAQRYRFVVLPNVYVMHYPHKHSQDEIRFREKAVHSDGSITHSRTYLCTLQIQEEFCRDLEKRYGYSRPPCERVHVEPAHEPAHVPGPFRVTSIVVALLLVVGMVYVCYHYCQLFYSRFSIKLV